MNLEIPSEILDLIPPDQASLSLEAFLLEALKLGLNTINSVSNIQNKIEDEIQHKSGDENSDTKNEEVNQDEVIETEIYLERSLEYLEKILKEEDNIDGTILLTSSNYQTVQILRDILRVPNDSNIY